MNNIPRHFSVSNKAALFQQERDMPVTNVKILTNPKPEWERISRGRSRVAHKIDIDWKRFNLNDYIFSHDSIVSSVETEANGYYIKPVCSKIVNLNGNAWTNPVLLATFRTFVGGQNYLEHCFPEGTEVLMSDGTYKKIEDIKTGDYVISHMGKKQKVSHLFKHEYSGEMVYTKLNHYKKEIISTGNHPFSSIDVSYQKTTERIGSKPQSNKRYEQDQIILALSEKKTRLVGFSAKEVWKNAELLDKGSLLLGGKHIKDSGISVGKISSLLGYYLAEGCLLTSKEDTGIVLVFGKHEKTLVDRVASLFKDTFQEAKVRVIDKTKDFSVWRIEVRSKTVSKIFRRLGGHLSHEKIISEEVLDWDRESLLNVLTAWLEGDGNFHEETGRIRGSTVSKKLGEQMLYLCNICGIKASLTFCKQKIGETVSTVVLPVNGERKIFNVIPRYNVWTLTISSNSVSKIFENSFRWVEFVPSQRKSPDFNEWHQKQVFMVSSVEKKNEIRTVYNIEVENDNSYIINPGVAVHNCQIPSQSKGTILDAVLRPFQYRDEKGNIANVYICDILVATNRCHWDLVQDIQTGKMRTLSMGTTCAAVQCSRCGKIFRDDDSCDHIKYELGQTFIDENGIERIIAELCGCSTWDETLKQWIGDPDSNTFIEASWVKHPAFIGAVVNHFINPKNVDTSVFRAASIENAIQSLFNVRVADRYGRLAINILRTEKDAIKRQQMIAAIIRGK